MTSPLTRLRRDFTSRALPAIAALVLGAVSACGSRQSMASKSAAAYVQAQQKGLHVSGGEHGSHAAAATTSESQHVQMAGMDHPSPPASVSVVIEAPRSSSEIARMRPDDVLGGDSLDAPAKLAVAEAAKTAGAAPAHTAHSTIETGKPEPVQAITDIYTCPMHPEVTSTAPGTCPKCGMTLVKKASKKDN